jgi:hypothetical protein
MREDPRSLLGDAADAPGTIMSAHFSNAAWPDI